MKDKYKSLLPDELYQQIEALYGTFQDIQKEVSGIVSQTNVSDTTAHLEDVLQSTEQATMQILDSATAIQGLSNTPEIAAEVTKIYEACNFQDLSGQRIKKVLKNLDALESGLKRLADSAKTYARNNEESAPAKEEIQLMNGPQLTNDMPSQEEIDKLFSSLK